MTDKEHALTDEQRALIENVRRELTAEIVTQVSEAYVNADDIVNNWFEENAVEIVALALGLSTRYGRIEITRESSLNDPAASLSHAIRQAALSVHKDKLDALVIKYKEVLLKKIKRRGEQFENECRSVFDTAVSERLRQHIRKEIESQGKTIKEEVMSKIKENVGIVNMTTFGRS